MVLRRFLRCAASAALVFTMCGVAAAQLGGNQRFALNVASNMSITPPAPAVGITHDETDGDQTFPPQLWQVRANAPRGATVSFSTNQPFTHTVDSTLQRDARLNLAIASSSGAAHWTLPVAVDQTNVSGSPSDGVAIVQAVSDKPGQATFELTVTFVTTQWDTLAAGSYELSVTGTITAN